jgi:hypothetical protein
MEPGLIRLTYVKFCIVTDNFRQIRKLGFNSKTIYLDFLLDVTKVVFNWTTVFSFKETETLLNILFS